MLQSEQNARTSGPNKSQIAFTNPNEHALTHAGIVEHCVEARQLDIPDPHVIGNASADTRKDLLQAEYGLEPFVYMAHTHVKKSRE